SPTTEKFAHRTFGDRIARWSRIGNPQIHLKRTCAVGPEFVGPLVDLESLHHERATSPEAAGVSHRDGERSGRGAGHRRQQNRHPKVVRLAEALDTGRSRASSWH